MVVCRMVGRFENVWCWLCVGCVVCVGFGGMM